VSFASGERRAKALLQAVAPPVPFNIEEFCRRVSQHRRRRPLLLVDEPAGSMGEAVGLLVGLADRDEIHYVADTSVYHQHVIILHEVGHLVSEHPGDDAEPFPLSLLSGDWDPEVVQRLKGRHRYDDQEECEAEDFATAVLDHVDTQARRAAAHDGGAAAGAPGPERLKSMFLR
jgi:hypothetical protein